MQSLRRMNYSTCPLEDLQQEAQRRNILPFAQPRDKLSEALELDDRIRGSEATTVDTHRQGAFVPRNVNMVHTAEFGVTAPAMYLINEKIVYWTMNTFFPTLQLFFESGNSCTIDGGQLPDARIGLDPDLRFKLTDCTHEEDGVVTNSILPQRYSQAGTGLVIKEITVAQRISIVLKPLSSQDAQPWVKSDCPHTRIATEVHTVVGIRLRGIEKMAYVWARTIDPSAARVWGDVRIAGLRNDVPIPNTCYPEPNAKPGTQNTVVVKDSLIKGSHTGV